MTAGFSSDVGPAVMVGAELRPIEEFSISIESRGVLPARAVAQEPTDRSKPLIRTEELDISNLSVLLVPCLHLSYFMGCAVGQAGLTINQSKMVTGITPGVAVGPRAGLEFSFGDRFGLRVFAEALFTPTQSIVSIEDANAQFKQSVVSAFFGATLFVSFK